MRKSTELKLLGLGFDTTLITKIDSKKQTLSSLKGQSRAGLESMGFSEEEAKLITSKVNRESIDDAVLQSLLDKCGEVCCYCRDGNSSRPFQIHHIVEYHQTQDNSEHNLMCVCPNHHVTIHKNKYAAIRQHEVKTAWQSLWKIAKEYQKKSIAFPFSSFDSIVYTNAQSNITEVFNLGTPTNNTCRDLTSGIFCQEVTAHLETNNHVILFGNSGSGKSTMAKGVAARFSDRFTIFEYIPSVGPNNQHNQIISTFLSEAVTPIVLIIDDANSFLSGKQIESILKISSSNSRLLITYTKNTYATDSDFEQHVIYDRFMVDWINLRPSIITRLLQHETDVVNHLRAHWTNRDNMHDLGVSFLTTSLEQLLNRYAYTVSSVWQFIFIIGGGINQAKKEYAELKTHLRFDIAILQICVTQIGDFEKGMSVEHINAALQNHAPLQYYAPNQDWIIEQLEGLIRKRIVKREMGVYKTIHRELAKEFIKIAYDDVVGKPSLIQILDPIFSDYRLNVRKIFVLASWLKRTNVSGYISNWANKLSHNDWNAIVNAAAQDDLQTLYILCEDLSLKFPNSAAITAAFSGNENAISQAILRNNHHTLRYTRSIFSLLKHEAIVVLQHLIPLISHQQIATKIKSAEIYELDDLNWLFSSIQEAIPSWMGGMRGTLSFEDIEKILDKCEKGRIDHIQEMYNLHGVFLSQLTRSQYKSYTDRIASCLTGCELKDIKFPHFGFSELRLFTADIDKIVNSLDTTKLASDFEVATPRNWGSLLELCDLIYYTETSKKVIGDLLDKINIDRLIENVALHYERAEYELRLLIYQFRYARSERKELFSELVTPFVENLLRKKPNDDDVKDLLKALFSINPMAGTSVALNLGKPLPAETDAFVDISAQQKEFEEDDRSGSDYVIQTYPEA